MFNIFEKFKKKYIRRKQERLIKLAEANGIYIPPASSKIRDRDVNGVIGMNYWTNSLKRRAEIAERELKKKGLI